MNNEDIIRENAEVLSNMTQMSIEEATEAIKIMISEFRIKDDDIETIIDKLNDL